MPTSMSSRERHLAAMRREPVDHVPLELTFWPPIVHEHLRWNNEWERLRTFDILGIDKMVYVRPTYSRAPGVTERVWQTEQPGSPYPLLHKEFQTPAGALSATVRRTEDWPWGEDIPFFDDFSPPRYEKPWIETREDLERLSYVLRPAAGQAKDEMVRQYREARALADEYGAAIGGSGGEGLDFACWFCGFEQAVLVGLEQPDLLEAIVAFQTELTLAKVELLCELGVDYIERRGCYESADFWSPALFRRFARPALEAEVNLAHKYNCPVSYWMLTGIQPLLAELQQIPFDLLRGIEASIGEDQQREIVQTLGGNKGFLGGVSATDDLHYGSPEQVRQAVRKAFDIYGRVGLILGTSVSIRHYFPWENVQAMIDEWKACR